MALVHAQERLWARLDSFPLDIASHPVPFTERLQREQNWPADFARRVVFEYRRFILLAATADAVVVPSDAVDQAWHLHLTDTRSYWSELCHCILGKPLHHTPSRGGPQEQAHYRDRYAATLERYREMFGEAAPSDIWPAPGTRFAGRYQRVDLEQVWVIPKTWFPSVGVLVFASIVSAGCADIKVGTAAGLALLGLVIFAVAAIVAHLQSPEEQRRQEERQRHGNSNSGGGAVGGCSGSAGGCSCPGGSSGCGSGGCGGGGGCGGS